MLHPPAAAQSQKHVRNAALEMFGCDDDHDDDDDDVMAGIKTTPSSDEHMVSITETQRRHVETVRLCWSPVSAGNPSDA